MASPGGTQTLAEGGLPRDRFYRPLVPDSANAMITALEAWADIDAIDMQYRSGVMAHFGHIDPQSVVIRRDSIAFRSAGRPESAPLSGVHQFVLRDRPSFGRAAALTGLVMVIGAGVAVFPESSRSDFGEAVESAGIGAAVALPFGLLLGRRDRYRRPVWVWGFDGP